MKQVFTQRNVGVWNTLPGEVVEVETIAKFIRYLDRYMTDMKWRDVRPCPGT